MDENIFQNYGVEVKLKDPQDFLKIKETLTRMGVSSKTQNKLYQSCHILHKRGRYAILHFKELLGLDGLETDTDETDIGRRNVIVGLLADWDLLEIVDIDKASQPLVSIKQLKIIPHKEKHQWELIPKYHIGKRKHT
jgi:hypothetical protein